MGMDSYRIRWENKLKICLSDFEDFFGVKFSTFQPNDGAEAEFGWAVLCLREQCSGSAGLLGRDGGGELVLRMDGYVLGAERLLLDLVCWLVTVRRYDGVIAVLDDADGVRVRHSDGSIDVSAERWAYVFAPPRSGPRESEVSVMKLPELTTLLHSV